MINVRLVIDPVNRQWIIGKIASRLAEHLEAHGVRAEIGEGPSDGVDVNHWMLYLQPWRHYYPAPGFFSREWRPAPTRHTAMITHVDDPVKVRIVREAMTKILDLGICMSRMTKAQLVDHGVDGARLTYINPAHDSAVQPRRVSIGITSRLYRDARKGEGDLIEVAQTMSLDAFRFEIHGKGWDAVAEILRRAGAEVELSDDADDYPRILKRLATFDYYLYLGWDEGSMGTLDALAAGVKTIVTPQGFHLDLVGGITHPFRDSVELGRIFATVRDDRQRRMDSVRELTWDAYARKHALVWRSLLEGRADDLPQIVDEKRLSAPYEITAADLSSARTRLFRRALNSEFWPFFAQSRRFWVRGKLSVAKRFLRRITTR